VLGRVATSHYDERGQVDYTVDARERRLDYTYDKLGRLMKRTYPDEFELTFDYDPNSNRIQMVDRHGTTYWTYDERNALIQRVRPGDVTTYYHFDAGGRRTVLIDPEAGATYYEYDPANRTRAIVDPFGQPTYFHYLANGLRDYMEMANGVTTYFAYDTGNRITQITHLRVADQSVLESFAYEHDPNSNRTQQTFGDGSYRRYTYSAQSVDRLEAENVYDTEAELEYALDFRYDLAGNRTHWIRQPAESGNVSETHYYEYDEANQFARIVKVEKPPGEDAVYTGCAYFTYDENGNTTAWARYDEADALLEASYYAWDDENQLLSVQEAVAGTTSYFSYDGDYQRVGKKDPIHPSYYDWDGLDVIVERDASGVMTDRHIHGPAPVAGIGTRLVSYNYRDAPWPLPDLWYQRDAVGSTRLLTKDDTPPTVGAKYDVNAWGAYTRSEGSEDTPFVFCGKERRTDTPDADLIYFGRRYYAPSLGRWLSRDPAKQTLNWYTYCSNNPMNRVDPSGLEWQWDDTRPLYVPKDMPMHLASPVASQVVWFMGGPYLEIYYDIKSPLLGDPEPAGAFAGVAGTMPLYAIGTMGRVQYRWKCAVPVKWVEPPPTPVAPPPAPKEPEVLDPYTFEPFGWGDPYIVMRGTDLAAEVVVANLEETLGNADWLIHGVLPAGYHAWQLGNQMQLDAQIENDLAEAMLVERAALALGAQGEYLRVRYAKPAVERLEDDTIWFDHPFPAVAGGPSGVTQAMQSGLYRYQGSMGTYNPAPWKGAAEASNQYLGVPSPTPPPDWNQDYIQGQGYLRNYQERRGFR
jgi:RHS repeat-associated protein